MIFPRVSAAILFTLAYTDQFDYPLTQAELFSRLIALDGKTVSQAQFEKEIALLQKQKAIEPHDDFLTLPGRAELIETRLRRARFSAKKWREIQLLQQMTFLLPDVLAIFVTGSLAMNNTESDDDIDLLVITKTNRLWVSRLSLLFLTWILGRKKRRFEEGKHGWCLNLWLDEDHLEVTTQKRDLYQAYEVIQATPILGDPETMNRFYSANAWVKTFLVSPTPATFPHLKKLVKKEPASSSLSSQLIDLLEKWAYSFQLQYMKSHRTTEKVGAGFAFFHPRPTATLVKDGWLKAIARSKKAVGIGTIAKHYVGKLFT